MHDSPYRILYVDDDADARDMMRHWMRYKAAGFEMTFARNSRDAVMMAAEEKFDLYIIDLWLPEIDGLQLCSMIRGIDPSAKIIFYSAVAREIDILNALRYGAVDFLVKPNDLEIVVPTIDSILGGHHRDDIMPGINRAA